MGFSSTDPTIMGKSNELSGAQKQNRRKSEEAKRKAEASKLRKISSLFKPVRAAFPDDEESTPLLQEQEDMETEICGPSTSEMNASTASTSGTDPPVSLAILSIESEEAWSLDIDGLIDMFADKKARLSKFKL